MTINQENAQIISDALLSRGWEPHQVAGIIGNLVVESRLDPNGPRGDNGTAHGLAQWRGDRFTNLQRFASERGTNWTDLETQALFIDHELRGSESYAGERLAAATSVEDAAAAFMHFERPQGYSRDNPTGGLAWAERRDYALAAEEVVGATTGIISAIALAEETRRFYEEVGRGLDTALEGYEGLTGEDAFMMQQAALDAVANVRMSPDAAASALAPNGDFNAERGLLSDEEQEILAGLEGEERAAYAEERGYDLRLHNDRFYDVNQAVIGEQSLQLMRNVGEAYNNLPEEERAALIAREDAAVEEHYDRLRENAANAARDGQENGLDFFEALIMAMIAQQMGYPELAAQIMNEYENPGNGTGPFGENRMPGGGRSVTGRPPGSGVRGNYSGPPLEELGDESLIGRRLDLDMSELTANANGIALVAVATGTATPHIPGEFLAVDVSTGMVIDSFTFGSGGGGPSTERQTNGYSPGITGELDFEDHADITARWGIGSLVYGGRSSWTDNDNVTWHITTHDPITGATSEYTNRGGMWIHPSTSGNTWGCFGMRPGDDSRFRRFWENQGGFPEFVIVTQDVYERSLAGERTILEPTVVRSEDGPAAPEVAENGMPVAVLQALIEAGFDTNNDGVVSEEETYAGRDAGLITDEVRQTLQELGVEVHDGPPADGVVDEPAATLDGAGVGDAVDVDDDVTPPPPPATPAVEGETPVQQVQ